MCRLTNANALCAYMWTLDRMMYLWFEGNMKVAFQMKTWLDIKVLVTGKSFSEILIQQVHLR